MTLKYDGYVRVRRSAPWPVLFAHITLDGEAPRDGQARPSLHNWIADGLGIPMTQNVDHVRRVRLTIEVVEDGDGNK